MLCGDGVGKTGNSRSSSSDGNRNPKIHFLIDESEGKNEDMTAKNKKKKPRYTALNYDYKPLPRVRVSEDYQNWTVIEEPNQVLELLDGTSDYQRYKSLLLEQEEAKKQQHG